MPAISNSSPLILYSRLRRLDLLHELFDEIVVPPAVHGEVLAEGGWHGDALNFALLPWLRVQPPPSDRLATLIDSVDPGEDEAIALAETYPHPTRLLLDDRIARRIARERGLFVIGSAGVLVLAKVSLPRTLDLSRRFGRCLMRSSPLVSTWAPRHSTKCSRSPGNRASGKVRNRAPDAGRHAAYPACFRPPTPP